MAKIAWGRGFFRTWMLLAIVWLIAVLGIGYGSIASPYVPTKVVATPAGDTIQMYDRYGAQQQEFDRGVAAGAVKVTTIRDDFLLYTRADIEPARLTERMKEARGLVDQYIVAETATRRTSAIGMVTVWAIFPPLIMLILGWAIGWVLNGFRGAGSARQ